MNNELIDLSSANSFLREHLGTDIFDVQEIGRGAWSIAYAYRIAEHEYVARFGRYIYDFQKDRFAARYASTQIPIPRVHEIGSYKDGFFIVSDRAYGKFLDALDGDEIRSALHNVLDTFNAIKQLDLSATSGYGGWDEHGIGIAANWHEVLLNTFQDNPIYRTHGWRTTLKTKPEYLAIFEDVERRFEKLVPFCTNERHLLHTDLLNRNILVKKIASVRFSIGATRCMATTCTIAPISSTGGRGSPRGNTSIFKLKS